MKLLPKILLIGVAVGGVIYGVNTYLEKHKAPEITEAVQAPAPIVQPAPVTQPEAQPAPVQTPAPQYGGTRQDSAFDSLLNGNKK